MKAQSKYYKNFWSGNIRQLRNVAEQISVLETNRDITAILQSYLPSEGSNLPSVIKK
jgi:DNA-binding NtrC family response regulator